MSRIRCTWPMVALLAAGGWAPAAGQPAADEWRVVVAPYLMGAAMSGRTAVRGREVDVDVDPIVGLTLRTPAANRLQLRIYTEIGGFGAGSDFSWQAFPPWASG